MMEKRLLAIGDGCRLALRFDGPVDAPVLLLSNSLVDVLWAAGSRVVSFQSQATHSHTASSIAGGISV